MTKTITVIKKRNNIFLLAVFFLVIIIFSYVVGVGYEKNLRNLSNFDNNFFDLFFHCIKIKFSI